MSTFVNNPKISTITFNQNVQAFCPIGHAWCTYQITVNMSPASLVPDYCEVEKFLRDMSGSAMAIETCVGDVYDWLMEQYEPYYLEVRLYCDDAVHFPVLVTKDSDHASEVHY